MQRSRRESSGSLKPKKNKNKKYKHWNLETQPQEDSEPDRVLQHLLRRAGFATVTGVATRSAQPPQACAAPAS